MRAHWSDGHLYSGDRLRKLQAKHYFLIDTGAGEKVFLNINQYVHRGILIVYVIRLILSVIIHCIIKILMEI